MKKYTKHNTLLLCLILVSLLFAACKDKGNEEVKQPTATTTALEGTWSVSNSISGSSTTNVITVAFSGANIVYTLSFVDSSTTPPTTEALGFTGTFRLDNANLYTKFNAASYTNGTITHTDLADVTTDAGGTLPVEVDNAEHLLFTFAVNGNHLTLTSPTNPSGSVTLTKL